MEAPAPWPKLVVVGGGGFGFTLGGGVGNITNVYAWDIGMNNSSLR